MSPAETEPRGGGGLGCFSCFSLATTPYFLSIGSNEEMTSRAMSPKRQGAARPPRTPPPRNAAQKERAANSLLRASAGHGQQVPSPKPWATRHGHTGRREISYGPIRLSISHSPLWSPTPH